MPTNLSSFTNGDLVISISGDGDGSGSYGDNQGSPITLEEVTTGGAEVGTLVLPQTTTVVNGTTEYAISGEYGSSSEGLLQLSADGRSLTIAGYGVNAQTYNAGGAAVYGNAALAQTTSVPNGQYVAVARVVADIGFDGTVDTSTALYNIFNTNNPRSVATVDGTSFFLSGQGVKGDRTQGVFRAADGANAATAIDTSTDTREAEIVNGQLYVSRDSTQGTGGTSDIAGYGPALPSGATAPSVLPGIAGTVTLTAGQANTVNAAAVGTTVHLSPESFFFANATTLYVADGGNPKEGGLGDGGLQKWTFNGTQWVLDYTLSQGLGLVANTSSAGTTGLIGLTGVVTGGTVTLYATNSTLTDTGQTYLFGIADDLGATAAPPGESFTTLVTAAPDSNIRGVAFAPSAGTAAPAATVVSAGVTSSGVTVTSGGSLTVLSGGMATATTVLSGGVATVSSGGVESGGTLAHGATETVFGSAAGDQVEGVQLVSAATATVSNETVYNGGVVELFLKGAAATGVAMTNGGDLVISGNATAAGTTVGSGGLVELQSAKAVLSGGFTFNGPGTLRAEAVASAGYGDQAVISGFATGDVVDLTVVGAGAALSTSMSGGNTVATVTSGAVSQSFTFAGSAAPFLALAADGAGGEEIVYSTPAPSNMVVSSGTTLSGAVVTSGSTLTVQSGGAVVSASVLSGGTVLVSGGGTDSGTTISAGGSETVLGSASGDVVSGTQLVSAATATVANETVVGGGSVDLYLKGAASTGLTVSSGGTLNISGNATANNTTLLAGGGIALQSPKAVLSGSLVFSGAATLTESAVLSAGFGDLAVISGFAAGDVVDLTAFAPGATLSSSVVGGNTVETVTGGGGSEAFTFAGLYAPGTFSLTPDASGGVELVAGVPCYCPGTLILTDRGEVPVETLSAGDIVVTASGKAKPIRWIGRRSYAGRFLRGRRHLHPVVIAAGALGDGLPRRALRVSPLHALLIDGVLVPAGLLVNGSTIVQEMGCPAVEYIHVELDHHDVILAEGAAAETFLDDGSRALFANAADAPAAPADDDRGFCAPRVEGGLTLERIRRRLAGSALAA